MYRSNWTCSACLTCSKWAIVALLVVACQTSSAKAQADKSPADGLHPRVRMTTTLGDMTVELDATTAPESVINLMDYVSKRYYDGLVFHRVLEGKLIQGGKFTPDMKPRENGLRPGINLEWTEDMRHRRGTVAMFHKFNVPNSTQAEFFINTRNNQSLSDSRDFGGYTVIGRIVDGMDVADKISEASLSTHPNFAKGRLATVPVSPIIIKTMRLEGDYDREAAQGVVKALQAETERLRQAAIDANQQAFDDAIARLEKRAGTKFTATESGLQYAMIREGTGAYPLLGDTIMYHYQVTGLDGRDIESTYRGEKAPHKKLSNLVQGLEEGVAMMREGGKWMFIMPPQLAFGDRGVPDRIAPGETVVFEFELFEILPPEDIDQ